MRFGFVTAVKLGLECLHEIYKIGGEIDLLLTLRDDISPDKSGRVLLDEFASEVNLPLHKIQNINDADACSTIREANLDWLFIVGWSQIAGPAVLTSAVHGCVGMHPTLLPTGRGRASIPWAILKGLRETGVTMFTLDEGVDTGEIIDQESVPIAFDETATTLYTKISNTHVSLVGRNFYRLAENTIRTRPQDDTIATTWPARRPGDGEIAPDMTVDHVDRLVRATTHPYPGAFMRTPEGDILRIWRGTRVPSMRATAIEVVDGTYWATDTSEG